MYLYEIEIGPENKRDIVGAQGEREGEKSGGVKRSSEKKEKYWLILYIIMSIEYEVLDEWDKNQQTSNKPFLLARRQSLSFRLHIYFTCVIHEGHT